MEGCSRATASVTASQAGADASKSLTSLRGKRPVRSTDVALEDGDERAEVAPALDGVFHVLDTIMGVRVDYFLAKRFESVAGGDDLIQDVGAVGILGHQSFEGLDLAANFSQADDERVLFAFRVNMSHAFSYAKTRRLPSKKLRLTVKGVGGI